MANSGDVKLLGYWRSPFVVRAGIALNLKSIHYEFLEDSYTNKSELLLKSNPIHKKVPVLIHGDKPLCESLMIVEYIDDLWSSCPSILPSDPYDRALARFWATYLDDKWFPSMRGAIMGQEEAKHELEEGLSLLEEAFGNISNGKVFFGGDQIGYLDIAFGCYLSWIKATEILIGQPLIDEAKTRGLAKWADHFSSVDAVKSLLPEPAKLVEFVEVLRANAKASPP